MDLDEVFQLTFPTLEGRTEARFQLFNSGNFSHEKLSQEFLQIFTRVQEKEFVSDDHKVIHFLPRLGRTKYTRTNLQDAVMNENLEKTLCLVEIHKWYHNDLFEINAKDSSNPRKTAFDMAYETGNSLLIDYLKENSAVSNTYVPRHVNL